MVHLFFSLFVEHAGEQISILNSLAGYIQIPYCLSPAHLSLPVMHVVIGHFLVPETLDGRCYT